LVAINLRIGMPDRRALEHAQAMSDLLADHFDGEAIYVGRRSAPNRDAQVAARRARGDSIRQIGRSLGMSRSAVHRALCRQGLSGAESVPLSGVTRDTASGDGAAHG